MSKITILIVTGLFPPEIGGPATYSKILLEELPVLGYEVKILPFSLVRKYPPVIRHLLFSWQIWRQLKMVDIVYAMDPVSVGLPVMIACLFSGRDYWLKVVGDYAWEQGSQRSGVEEMLDVFSVKTRGYGWLVRVLKITQTAVARRAKHIIVPSFYLKKIVSNWGIDPKKIDVVYNAFEGSDLNFSKENVRSQLKLEGQIIISVGRLVPWKGFDTLIDLMPRLLIRHPQVKLLIVGDGPEGKNLRDKIEEKKLGATVKLLGRLPQDKLFQYLSASDLFVLNTAYEGFSHQLLEVMMLQTPVVTTKIGGNPELIKDQESGFLVPYNDSAGLFEAVSKILSDQNLAFRLAKQAKETAAGFTRNRMVDGLVKLFESDKSLKWSEDNSG